MKKRILLHLLLSGFAFSAMAQSDLSNFTVTGSGLATTLSTDYESVGINPSNLGWDNTKKVHFGLLEGGYSIYSDALTKAQYSNNFLLDDGDIKLGTGNNTTTKQQAAIEMANKGYALNVNETLLGLAVQLPGIGGFGFAIKAVGSDYVHLNATGADITYNGSNAAYFHTGSQNEPLSQLYDGSKIYTDIHTEYDISYGRQLFHNDDVKVYGGVGIKIVESYGMIDIESKGQVLTAFTAFAPNFNVDYGRNPNGTALSPAPDTTGGLTPIGSGVGFDFGGSVIIKDKIKIGLSIDDIGSITYTGNIYSAPDNTLKSTISSGLAYFANYKNLNALVGGEGIFKLQSTAKTQTISMPTNFRLGASYDVMKSFTVGLDFMAPLADVPGSLAAPQFGVGAQLKLLNFLKLSAGISVGGNSGFNIPLGICLAPGKGTYEIGVATRDILYLASSTNPNASILLGFLRFGF
jgi:hypothetical protein